MELRDFKYINELNIQGFIHMLDDSTECYKFYWLDALLSIFLRGQTEILFDDLINKMIVDAWYSVGEYHLHLGPKDANGKIMNSLERAVIKLLQISDLPSSADEKSIMLAIKEHDKQLSDEKKQLALNVPYRLLSSFMSNVGGNDKIWAQRKRLIEYIEQLNNLECIPYKIVNGIGLKKKVVISETWQAFLKDNYVTISGWIEVKKVRYLQGRNPSVPGIIYKLAPENDKQRKLKYVRELWNMQIEINPVYDIYTKKQFDKNNFEVDHFVPWSFITNDELWNLIPMDSSLNSSKSNKLPEWDKYFKTFAENQYTMYQNVLKYEKIMNVFQKCQRDNLNTPWSTEELYVAGCNRGAFTKILHRNLYPIYDSAKMQGYKVWEM